MRLSTSFELHYLVVRHIKSIFQNCSCFVPKVETYIIVGLLATVVGCEANPHWAVGQVLAKGLDLPVNLQKIRTRGSTILSFQNVFIVPRLTVKLNWPEWLAVILA